MGPQVWPLIEAGSHPYDEQQSLGPMPKAHGPRARLPCVVTRPRNLSSRSLRADAHRSIALSSKTQVMQQGAESEPVQAFSSEFLSLSEFLSKIGTHLLASLGSKGKNRNSLACLRNAGSYSAESYCKIPVPSVHHHSQLSLSPAACAHATPREALSSPRLIMMMFITISARD